MFDVLFAARWVHFVALFAMVGGAFFWAYAGRDALDGAQGLPATLGRTLLLLRIAAALAAGSGIAWLGGTIANATGGWETLADLETLHVFFVETPFGVPAMVRFALFAILIAIVIAPASPRLRIGASLGAGTVLLMSQAWLGHAVEGGATMYGAVMIVAYAAHVLAAAAWVGGLPPLAFALVERHAGSDAKAVLDLSLRYSAMAMVAVGVIIFSGVANTAFHTGGSLAELAASGYGVILFTKLVLVATMLLLAAINRFAIMPRLQGDRDLGAKGFRALRKSIVFEGVLAVLALGAAAVLGITPPPH